MAVDTAQKRFSIMNLGSPWRGLMIVPTGTVDDSERLAFLYLYSGIAAGALVAVPDVVGQLEANATTTLQTDGFVVSVTYAASSSVQAGKVISQSPAAGQFAASGSTVSIVVSLGDSTTTGGWEDYARRSRKYEITPEEVQAQREKLGIVQAKRPILRKKGKKQDEVPRETEARHLFEPAKKLTGRELAIWIEMITGDIQAAGGPNVPSVEQLVIARALAIRRMEEEDMAMVLMTIAAMV